jgi:hypothetical protein
VTIKIPDNIFEGLVRWMVRGSWPEHFQQAIHEHTGFYCEAHDIDSFEELADRIGGHWVSVLNDIAFNDFLGRETEDGNVVEQYLKRRGWKETKVARAYLEGIRDSVVSLYEVSDIVPGDSFLARDLIRDGEPFHVLERSATKTMAPWEQFAMRIVNVRGQNIIAGGLLPLKPELADDLLSEFNEMVAEAESQLKEVIDEAGAEGEFDEAISPQGVQAIALGIALKSASSFFATAWMAATPLHPDEQTLPQLFNFDGDEVEFIQLVYRFEKGTTQAQIRKILDSEADMEAASDKVWNWVDRGQRARPNLQKALPEGGQMYNSQLDDGSPVLGMITLKGRTLEADISSEPRADEIKARLTDLLGDLVKPPLMVRQTLEQAVAAHRENGAAPDPVDLSEEEQAAIQAEVMAQHYQNILDQPIGLLDDKTPRESVRTAKGRRKIAAWLKILERNEAKARAGTSAPVYDFSWMWQELGVIELRK